LDAPFGFGFARNYSLKNLLEMARRGEKPMKTEQSSSKMRDVCVTNRRDGDRRKKARRTREEAVAIERGSGSERRKGERRRQIDPTTCERDYSEEEILFMRAMDQYKRDNRRPFPTWSEVLEVLRALGYRKVAEPTALPGLKPGQSRGRVGVALE
jgi:hypothetical protein